MPVPAGFAAPSMDEVVAATGATASVIRVPPPVAADSTLGGAEDKITAMGAAGIRAAASPSELRSTLVEVLKG